MRIPIGTLSKKNKWKSGNGHVFLPGEASSVIESIEWALKAAWCSRSEPLIHPDITIRLGVSSLLQDHTNLYQTVEDAMVRAGILEDDCLSCCNGRVTLTPAELVDEGEEFIELSIG